MSLRNFLLLNIPMCFIQMAFLHLSLKCKYNKYLTFILLVVPFTFLALMKQTIPGMNPIVSSSSAIIYSFVFSITMYRDNLKKKILEYLINYAISFAVNFISLAVYALLSGDITNPDISYMVMFNIVLAMGYLIIFIARRKQVFGTENNRFTILGIGLLVFSHMVISFCMEAFFFGNDVFEENSRYGFNIEKNTFYILLFVIIGMILFLTDILMVYVMNRASKSVAMQKDIELYEYKQSLYADYYAEIEENSEQTRKIRHDMANIAEVIGAMIHSNNLNDKEIANELYEKLQADIQNIKNEVYCSDNLLNAILSIKANICRSRNIQTEFSVSTDKFSILEKTDLCKIATNMLDNAIKATDSAEEEKKIIFRITSDENSLFISSVNPIGKRNQIAENDKAHGYGLKIIRDVASKYKGELDTVEKSGVYISQIIIPI